MYVLKCNVPGDEPEINIFTKLDQAIEYAVSEMMECECLDREEVVVLTGSDAVDQYGPSVVAAIVGSNDLENDEDDEDEIVHYTITECQVDPVK